MKTKRFVSTLLALLLICSLPVSAFAMENNPNGNTVDIIHEDDTMTTNYGTVTENHGEVTTNNGIVTENHALVTVNESGGVVTCNGTVTDNANAEVVTNNGRVVNNWGTVETNNNEIDANYDKSIVTTNSDNGIVNQNSGTVKANNGTVSSNTKSGTVGTNNGTVGDNTGTVDINNGTVNNEGTVNTNNITGTVTNYSSGKVGTNYGTVIDGKDNYKTTYGVQVDGALFQKNEGEDFDLTQFTKAGYEFAGYTREYQMVDGVLTQQAVTVNSTSYLADCPNILTLIWRAITGQGESAGYFGPGCYISLNGKQYILTEIKGEDYYLASCEEYTQEELAEAGELLESLLTEEQLSHVTGEAGILEGELNELFFGGGSRIVFPCDIGMIFY